MRHANEYKPLVGQEASMEGILLHGETVNYTYTVPRSKLFKRPLFIVAVCLPFLFLGIFLVEPLALGAPWPTTVGLGVFGILPFGLIYFAYTVQIQYVVTNLRVLKLTQRRNRLTLLFQFYNCIEEFKKEDDKIIFRPYFIQETDAHSAHHLLQLEDLMDDIDYVYDVISRMYREQQHNDAPPVKPVTLQPSNSVNDLSESHYCLLLEYMAENPDDHVQYVYIPSLWQTWKMTIIFNLGVSFAICWIMSWLSLGPAKSDNHSHGSSSTDHNYKLELYIIVFVVPLLIFAFSTLFGAYLLGSFKQAYAITNRAILTFGMGMALLAQASDSSTGSRNTLFGSTHGSHLVVKYISSEAIGMVNMTCTCGNMNRVGNIYFGTNRLPGLYNVPYIADKMQFIANMLLSSATASAAFMPTPTPTSIQDQVVIN